MEKSTVEERAIVASEGKEPIRKVIKVSPSKVGGKMLDHFKRIPVSFLLEGDPNDAEVDRDTIILEFYDEQEWRFFQRMNRPLLEGGYLMEFEGETTPLDTRNVLSDSEIEDVLKKPFLALSNLLKKTDSQITVRRIHNMALSMNSSIAFVQAIERRLAELQEADAPPPLPDRMESELL